MADAAWRLFLALWPPAAVRDALVRLQQARDWPPGAALVRPERLHLTLHFIGSVPAGRVPALETELRVPFAPFTLDARGATFETWRGGIAVFELQAPPALRELHAALADALRRCHLPVEERRYRPHVTLARKASRAPPPAPQPMPEWRAADGYTLVRTVPGQGYTVVHRHG